MAEGGLFGEVQKYFKNRRTISPDQYVAYVTETDRENLNLILDEIQRNGNGQEMGSVALVVGGMINRPGGEHKDLDVKISVKRNHSSTPVTEAIEETVKTLSDNGAFAVEKVREKSKMTEEGWVWAYNFNPTGRGTTIQIVPPFGMEDIPAELEMTSGRGPNRKCYLVRDFDKA